MANKPPAFQLYVKDWLTSPTVLKMTRQDRGDYINLLCSAWNSDEPGTLSLPLSLGAKEAGIRPQILRSFLRRFPEVFKRIDGRLVNEKLHDQWLRYKEISNKRAGAANVRHANAQQMDMQTGGSAVAVASAVASAHSNTTTNSRSLAQNQGERDLPGFALFWEAYPKKIGKPIARRAWLSKVKDDSRWPDVLASLEIWKSCEQWQDPQFIPYPATFLNQMRWQDEVPKTGGTKNDQRISRNLEAAKRVMESGPQMGDTLGGALPRGIERAGDSHLLRVAPKQKP